LVAIVTTVTGSDTGHGLGVPVSFIPTRPMPGHPRRRPPSRPASLSDLDQNRVLGPLPAVERTRLAAGLEPA